MNNIINFIQEKLNINSNSKINKEESYSFYINQNDIKEGDKVLFACKCGEGNGVLVKCIIDKIIYSKINGHITDKIYNIKLKLDDSNYLWIKDDNTIKEFVENGVYNSGYKIETQLLKLNN